MHSPTGTLQQSLTAAALQSGAAAVGYVQADVTDADAMKLYQEWLSEKCHGSMHYLERWMDIRRKPALLLEIEGECTLMVCAYSYYHTEHQLPQAAPIAMYAHGSDYHKVLRTKLEPIAQLLRDAGHKARVCIDSAPLAERHWAIKAGIGFRGRNGMLIVPHVGSWVFIATIVTDAPLIPSHPPADMPSECIGCNRCVEACPGGAIRPGKPIDASRCLAYLTIEAPSEMLNEQKLPVVYGCDVCQSVCPHNASPLETVIDEFTLRPTLRGLTAERIIALTESDFSTLMAGSPIKRRKLAPLKAAALRYCPR